MKENSIVDFIVEYYFLVCNDFLELSEWYLTFEPEWA